MYRAQTLCPQQVAQNTSHSGLLKGHKWRGSHTDLTNPADEALHSWGTRSTPRKGAAPPHDAGSAHRKGGEGSAGEWAKPHAEKHRGASHHRPGDKQNQEQEEGHKQKEQANIHKKELEHAKLGNCLPNMQRP